LAGSSSKGKKKAKLYKEYLKNGIKQNEDLIYVKAAKNIFS